MSSLFGPQTRDATNLLPASTSSDRYGSQDSWFADCNNGGSGTTVDAAFLNNILGNMRTVVETSGVSYTTGDMTNLYRAIYAIAVVAAQDTILRYPFIGAGP